LHPNQNSIIAEPTLNQNSSITQPTQNKL
jgi:hypothetical protein